MFETAELGRRVGRRAYDARVPKLRTELLEAQDRLKAAGFAVILLINGVDGAGKGETVNLLHEWFDARYLETSGFGQPSEEEHEQPAFWRFWRALPPAGRIGIFVGSWYSEPILERAYRHSKNADLDAALVRINALERMLVDDGALIVKFWFHLSKAAQRHRLETLEKSRKTRWRVTKTDWKHFGLYDRFRKVSERALRETSTGEAPWTVIEGADHRYRDLTVGEHLLGVLRRRLDARRRARPARAVPAGSAPRVDTDPLTVLDGVDLSLRLGKERYEKDLEKFQGRLSVLHRKAYKHGVSCVLVFEGWDAAGKGGVIRRITPALDARSYRVIPIAAPTDEERAHHYLWRFWRRLPRAGHVAFFDRSWYGRVLVERVEGFASPAEWGRAYAEIDDFEEQLCERGIVLVKFWLHIDPAEQMRRFKDRERKAFKRYKITQEDLRNRRKWPAYEIAANEMFGRTSTEYAPWTLVAANDKRHARIEVLKTFAARLEEAL